MSSEEKTNEKQTNKKKSKSTNKKEDKILKKLKEEIQLVQSQKDELTDKYKRLAAEFDNYKKRSEKEYLTLIQNANEKLISDLLPVVDDLERSLSHLKEENDFESMSKGLQLIQKNLLSILEKEGLKPMQSIGEEFDPDKHDALLQVENKEFESNTIVDEHLKGYVFNDKVIRHAQVIVAK